MTPVKTPHQFSFVNNPVYFELLTTSTEMVDITVSIDAKSFALSVFPVYYDATHFVIKFEISDILRPFLKFDYDASEVFQTNIPGFITDYTVTATEFNFTGKIVQGGVSKEFTRWLTDNGTNAFDYRFLNPMDNFLFITRTNKGLVKIDRTELPCFFFLAPSNDAISIETDKGDILAIPGTSQGMSVMVNIPLFLRNKEANGVVSTIYFRVAEVRIITVQITDNDVDESYLLKFKNSLGVYEFLQITGIATQKTTPSEDSFNAWDEEQNDFVLANNRLQRRDSITISTGYKSTEEMMQLIDILISPSTYFINGLQKRKCKVTSSDFGIAIKKTIPEAATLTIDFSSQEQNYLQYNYTPVFDIDMIIFLLSTEKDEWIVTDNTNFISV